MRIDYNTNNIYFAAKYVAADCISLYFNKAHFSSTIELEKLSRHYRGQKDSMKQSLTDGFTEALDHLLGRKTEQWGDLHAVIFFVNDDVIVDAGIFKLVIRYDGRNFRMKYSELRGITLNTIPKPRAAATPKKERAKIRSWSRRAS